MSSARVSLAVLTFAMIAGRAAAAEPPRAPACSALNTVTFAAGTALTTRYDAGSASQPVQYVVRGSAASADDGQIRAVEAFMRILPVEKRNGGWE